MINKQSIWPIYLAIKLFKFNHFNLTYICTYHTYIYEYVYTVSGINIRLSVKIYIHIVVSLNNICLYLNYSFLELRIVRVK